MARWFDDVQQGAPTPPLIGRKGGISAAAGAATFIGAVVGVIAHSWIVFVVVFGLVMVVATVYDLSLAKRHDR